MILSLVRLLAAIVIAFFAGKLISKIKLPSILGWFIAGMILGPHAVSLMNQEILDAGWYQTVVHILECAVGLMIGTELVWNKIKRSGKAIVITTLTQSLGTFLFVSLVFGIVFHFQGIPLYLAFLFGGIALATAPAPALSIVREFKTNGPVTNTLIPMAALDDIVGCVVFFTTTAVVAGNLSAGELPAYMIALVVILPLAIGAATGLLAGITLKKERNSSETLIILILNIRFQQYCNAQTCFEFYADRYGVFRNLFQYGHGEETGRDHGCFQSLPRNCNDYCNFKSGRASGLPSDHGSRAVYRYLYYCKGAG